MTSLLTRDDITDGIREIIARLTEAGIAATIQIVGGAAIALTIDGDRPATADVDGPFTPPDTVEAIAVQIAKEHGWPLDWVNDKAKILLPDGIGRSAEWVTLYDQDGILVQAASAAMLLAMKLRAAERRGLRDFGDVDVLLTVLGIRTVDEAEDLMNEFFPSEDLSPRTYDRVQKLLEGEPRVGSAAAFEEPDEAPTTPGMKPQAKNAAFPAGESVIARPTSPTMLGR